MTEVSQSVSNLGFGSLRYILGVAGLEGMGASDNIE